MACEDAWGGYLRKIPLEDTFGGVVDGRYQGKESRPGRHL